MNSDEIAESIEEIFPTALRQASLEAFEGNYDEIALAAKIDASEVKRQTLHLLQEAQAGFSEHRATHNDNH